MIPFKAADGPIGGEKGVLCQIFRFLIVVDQPVAYREDQPGMISDELGKCLVVHPDPPPPFPSAHPYNEKPDGNPSIFFTFFIIEDKSAEKDGEKRKNS